MIGQKYLMILFRAAIVNRAYDIIYKNISGIYLPFFKNNSWSHFIWSSVIIINETTS